MNYPIMTKLRNALRDIIVGLNVVLYKKLYKIRIGQGTVISFQAKIDKTNPKGVNIGKHTYISNGAIILSHDFINKKHVDTYIGDNVFIGANAIIMPGVIIESNSIVAAGAIVTKKVCSGTIVAGNPAVSIKTGLDIGKFGKKV